MKSWKPRFAKYLSVIRRGRNQFVSDIFIDAKGRAHAVLPFFMLTLKNPILLTRIVDLAISGTCPSSAATTGRKLGAQVLLRFDR